MGSQHSAQIKKGLDMSLGDSEDSLILASNWASLELGLVGDPPGPSSRVLVLSEPLLIIFKYFSSFIKTGLKKRNIYIYKCLSYFQNKKSNLFWKNKNTFYQKFHTYYFLQNNLRNLLLYMRITILKYGKYFSKRGNIFLTIWYKYFMI